MEKAVVAALEDIKARDIVVLKVAHLSSLFERMIIASADSTRQVKALADNVREKLKELGAPVLSVEGRRKRRMGAGGPRRHRGARDAASRPQYYNLEELWDQPEPKRRARASPRPNPAGGRVRRAQAAAETCRHRRRYAHALLGTDGYRDYAKRMPPGTALELVEIRAEARTSGKTVAQMLAAEAARMRAALPKGARVIALDERGKD